MADWYYSRDNAQQGPVSDLEIRNLITTRQITEETIIWREGMEGWLPLKDVQDFQSAAADSATAPDTAAPLTTPQSTSGIAPGTAATTDGLAIASLVCGILSIVFCGFFTGIPAVICGHKSLAKIKANPSMVGGKVLAIIGLVTGYLSIAFSVLFLIVFFLAFITEIPTDTL
jgi:hypothetical protein